jgi:hypothetical protein
MAMFLSFPSPDAARAGTRVFRAPRLWEFNVCGAAVAGIAGAVLFLVAAGVWIWMRRSLGWFPLFLILGVAVALFVIFPGHYLATYPYAVEVEEGKGLRLYAPFTRMYVPLGEIREAKWSYIRTGWVVRLKRRRGLLSRVVIHVAWGPRGRDVARAIEEQLAHRGQAAN